MYVFKGRVFTINHELIKLQFLATSFVGPSSGPIYSFMHFFNIKVQVIKLLSEFDIFQFCPHVLMFMASIISNYRDYFCYNIHVYNVVCKL